MQNTVCLCYRGLFFSRRQTSTAPDNKESTSTLAGLLSVIGNILARCIDSSIHMDPSRFLWAIFFFIVPTFSNSRYHYFYHQHEYLEFDMDPHICYNSTLFHYLHSLSNKAVPDEHYYNPLRQQKPNCFIWILVHPMMHYRSFMNDSYVLIVEAGQAPSTKNVFLIPYHSSYVDLQENDTITSIVKNKKYDISLIAQCGNSIGGNIRREIFNAYDSSTKSIKEKSFVRCTNNPNSYFSKENLLDIYQNSRFCIVPVGDTQSSNRITETIMNNCMPILVGPPFHSIPFNLDIPSARILIIEIEQIKIIAKKFQKDIMSIWKSSLIPNYKIKFLSELPKLISKLAVDYYPNNIYPFLFFAYNMRLQDSYVINLVKYLKRNPRG